MKSVIKNITLPLLAAGLLIAGCKEPGPVELRDDGHDGRIEVVAPPPAPMPGMELGDADSSGIVPLPTAKVFGHLLVAGSRFDGPLVSTQASLGRAIFFDRDSAVLLPPGRTTYATLDMGVLALNASLLLKIDKSVRFGSGDTVLGPQYIVYNRLTGGFQYTGGATYTWTGTGGGLVPPFTAEITAPDPIVVQNLDPAATISLKEDLRVRWTGGGDTVGLVISLAGETRIDQHPILHMRLGRNRHEVVIPGRILALLPRDRNRFVFTFFSGEMKIVRFAGYPDDVLVQALTSHSIVVQVTR